MTFGWLFGYSQEEEYVTNEDLEDLFDEDKDHSGTGCPDLNCTISQCS